MPNPYEFIFGGQIPDDTRMKAMAGNLRGQDSRALLALISGDPVLGQAGQSMMQDSKMKAGGLAKARAQLQAAQTQQQQFAEQQALREQQLSQQAEQAELDRLNRLEIAKLRMQDQNQRADASAAKERRANMRRLSEKLESTGVLEAEHSINTFFDTLKKEGILDKEGVLVENIPGQGGTKAAPDFAVGQTGKVIRQQLAGIRNKLLKLRSGAAVTDPEMNRLIEELGTGVFGTDQDLMNAMNYLKNSVTTIKHGLLSGYEPDIVDEYMGQLQAYQAGQTAPMPGYAPQPAAPGMPATPPANVRATPKGTQYEVIEE